MLFGGRLFSGLWLIPLAGLLILPLSVSWLRWRRWRWDIGDAGIDIRHGTLTERRTLIPWIRVQHVETARGLTEQALGLATVVVHTAADSHSIPMLRVREAEALRERIGALARTIDAEWRRLHPAAIAVYSADALKNLAFPLLLIIGVSLLGGRLDTQGLKRTAIYGGDRARGRAGRRDRALAHQPLPVEDDVIHHRTGLLAGGRDARPGRPRRRAGHPPGADPAAVRPAGRGRPDGRGARAARSRCPR